MGLRSQLGYGVGSLERLRALVGANRPASVRNLLARYSEPFVIDEPLDTPDGVALGGQHRITIERDGKFRHEGHLRATGEPSFTYGIRTVVDGSDGTPIVFAANGRVHGTLEFGDRESHWDHSGQDGLVALYWGRLKGARAHTDINRDSDFFGTVSDVFDFFASLAALSD